MAFTSAYLDDNGLAFPVSTAGGHSEGTLMRPRQHDIVSGGFFHWREKRLPSPGAGNFAFETLSLHEFTPIGAGVAARQGTGVRAITPPMYANNVATMSGLGGIAQGQIFSQPLIDPGNMTYGGFSG